MAAQAALPSSKAMAGDIPLSARTGDPDNLRFWVPESLASGGELSTPRTWIPDRVVVGGGALDRPRRWLSPPQRERPKAPEESLSDLASLMRNFLAPSPTPQITRVRAPTATRSSGRAFERQPIGAEQCIPTISEQDEGKTIIFEHHPVATCALQVAFPETICSQAHAKEAGGEGGEETQRSAVSAASIVNKRTLHLDESAEVEEDEEVSIYQHSRPAMTLSENLRPPGIVWEGPNPDSSTASDFTLTNDTGTFSMHSMHCMRIPRYGVFKTLWRLALGRGKACWPNRPRSLARSLAFSCAMLVQGGWIV